MAFILGDHCRPASDRAWAGMKILGMGGLMAGGGIIARGLLPGAGGLIKGGKKLLSGGGPRAGSGGFDLAMGLDDGLREFAAGKGAKTYFDFFGDRALFIPKNFEVLVQQADNVIVNTKILVGPSLANSHKILFF